MLCGGLSGLGCFGGPTSDWPPSRNHDGENSGSGKNGDRAPSASDDDPASDDDSAEPEDEESTPTKPEGSKRDAGRKDAGTPTLIDAGLTPPSSAGQGDGGASDADVQRQGGECALVLGDAGVCAEGACDELPKARSSETGTACIEASSLPLACSGELSRIITECAEHEVRALGFGRSVASCARREPALAEVGDACLDCYANEVVCSLRSCLVECLDGSSSACRSCRALTCGVPFSRCSGLRAPVPGVE